VTLILGNLSYPENRRDDLRVTAALSGPLVSGARSATPKIPAPRGSRPPRLEEREGEQASPRKVGIMLANVSTNPICASTFGNEARNPARRVRVPIKQGGVACAEIAKKPKSQSLLRRSPSRRFWQPTLLGDPGQSTRSAYDPAFTHTMTRGLVAATLGQVTVLSLMKVTGILRGPQYPITSTSFWLHSPLHACPVQSRRTTRIAFSAALGRPAGPSAP
jgi:hypothetical protein